MSEVIPLVSVCMVSYNQEQYIRDAVDSVLMQKTSFPMEIIISDDCSNDTTPNILTDYSEKFPNIIRLMLGRSNLGYPNNQRRSLEAARGKYIALCDGDDYWTDSYKLQKQVDYMESNPDCAICFHNVMNIYESDDKKRTLLNPLDFPTELSCSDLIRRKWFLPTNSEVFRKEYLFFPEWYDTVLHIDYVLNLIISQYGRLHYMPDVMAVYRHTKSSVNRIHGTGRFDYLLFHSGTMKTILQNMKKILPQDYRQDLDNRIARYESEIKEYENEKYYEKHIISRLLRPKTYTRFVKKMLKHLIEKGG